MQDIDYDFDALHAKIAWLRARQIFFICGAMKSGTTWVQLLLNAHPRISCNGEGHFMDVLAVELGKALDAYNAYIDDKNRGVFSETVHIPKAEMGHLFYLLSAQMCLLMTSLGDGKDVVAVGEKTPDNIAGLPTLALLFPKAKFIHVVRDGRDCAVSAWFHNLRLDPERTAATYGTFDRYVENHAHSWAAVVAAGTEFGRTVPERFTAVRYEDLIADTPVEVGKLCGFLGVPTTPNELADSVDAASFSRLSGGRAQGTESRASFFRRGVVGDWRNHLGGQSEQAFAAIAGPWLRHFRY